MSTVVVASRFRGPTTSGNGGFTAGLLAGACGLGGPVQVTLRTPPPLERPLQVHDGVLLDGDTVVAQAEPGTVTTVPEPVGLATARAAEQAYAGLLRHPFPECFVCGPAREPGDGMRLFPGRIGDGRTACSWTPGPEVDLPFVWAALDCPGAWTSDVLGRPMVLGRMTASVEVAVVPGRPYVVTGTHLLTEGRKTRTATALLDADGEVVARSEQVWIAIDPGAFG
jgi:hypothetical protein